MLPLVIASFVLFGGSVHAADATRVRTEIQPLLNELLLAANVHDTDRFLASYLRDQSLVLVFDGEITMGWDDVRALQLKWWNNGKSDVAYSKNGKSKFTILGPKAVVVTDPMVSLRKLSDGRVSRDEFVVTMVWEKRSEGWRIVQVHESTLRK